MNGFSGGENSKRGDARQFQMAWTREAASLLIELYSQRPSLYKTNSPEYYDRNKRQKCLVEIATRLMEVRGPTTEDEVRAKINGLRTQYQSEVNKIEASKKNVSLNGNIYQPKLWCFNQLQFLREHITPRKTMKSENAKFQGGAQVCVSNSLTCSFPDDGMESELEVNEHNSYSGVNQQEDSDDSTVCRHLEIDYHQNEEEDSHTLKRQRTYLERRDYENSYNVGPSTVSSNTLRGNEDKYDIFGKYLASELRDITNDSLFLHAKKEILSVLMEYQLKQLELNKMGM